MCGCAGTGTPTQISGISQPNQSEQQVQCPLTREMLVIWKNAITCVKQNGKQDLIGLPGNAINAYIGLVQSAINYPDYYCYYWDQLQIFQSSILPRIIENVPECIQ